MKKIIVVGPNPAYQQILVFSALRRGAVNRAVRMENFPAGKAVNFCRAVVSWGRAVPELHQFAGGDNGRKLVRDLEQGGFRHFTTPVAAATRCCHTCVDETDHTMTELIEPSLPPAAAERQALLRTLREQLPEAAAMAVCGSLPDGTPESFYAELAAAAHEAGVPLLLDAWKGVGPALQTGVNYLKINREELAELTGLADVEAGLAELFRRFRLAGAAITDGGEPALASDGHRTERFPVKKLANPVNFLGCGDTSSAVWLSELVNGTDLFTAFACSLAAATANCLSLCPGQFNRSDC